MEKMLHSKEVDRDLEIVNFQKKHLPDFIKLYNQVFKNAYYCYPLADKYVEIRILNSIIFNPNYFLTMLDRNKPIAFCLGHEKKTPSDTERRNGYLFLILVAPSYQRRKIGTRLIQELANRFRKTGRKSILITWGWFSFWPGINHKWILAIRFLESLGFKKRTYEGSEKVSMVTSLKAFNASKKYLDKERNLNNQGIVMERFKREYSTELKVFIRKNFNEGWYYTTIGKTEKGIEKFDGHGAGSISTYAPDEVLIVSKNKTLIGFSVVQYTKPRGYFGPIGVLEEYRGLGIGNVLLHRSLAILFQKGSTEVDLWTDLNSFMCRKFYPNLGFKVKEAWIEFEKGLYKLD